MAEPRLRRKGLEASFEDKKLVIEVGGKKARLTNKDRADLTSFVNGPAQKKPVKKHTPDPPFGVKVRD